jgi:hypothetical protein
MNLSPNLYRTEQFRREDIMRQAEQHRLARTAQENSPAHNTFATLKNRVSSALARSAAQGSTTSEGLGEGIALS